MDKIKSILNKKYVPLYIFLLIEIIIYMKYLTIDIFFSDNDTTYLRYSSIIVLFIYCFIGIRKWDLTRNLYRFAICFTLIADLFLLVLDNYYLIGVTSFILAQITYLLLLNWQLRWRFLKASLFIELPLLSALILILFILKVINPFNLIIISYFSLLITNFGFCLINLKKGKQYKILTISFFLFILCDINVGLYNIDIVLDNSFWSYVVSFSMWMFYLPSQIGIFWSFMNEGDNNEEKYS